MHFGQLRHKLALVQASPECGIDLEFRGIAERVEKNLHLLLAEFHAEMVT